MLKKKLSIKWSRLIIPVIVLLLFIGAYILFSTNVFNIDDSILGIINKIGLGFVFLASAWTLNKALNILINYGLQKNSYDSFRKGKGDLHQRKVESKMRYIKIVLNIIIYLVALALVLYQFESLRRLSTSILASAGVAGIILAFSAQKLFANILAGFEVAFSQPIRLNDVVVLEGEWGTIEEINATHVVVRIWDRRRLVVPITYFVEKPFQNWTKNSSDILSSVEFYVDYTMPVQKMREQLTKLLKSSPLWDGEVDVLQVTDASEKTMKVRALMTTKDAPTGWDLKCYVREKMIAFLQENYADHLPRLRAEMKESDEFSNKKEIRKSKK